MSVSFFSKGVRLNKKYELNGDQTNEQKQYDLFIDALVKIIRKYGSRFIE